MYGLSSDSYNLHSDLYSRAAHGSSSRLGAFAYPPDQGIPDWQQPPGMPNPAPGKPPYMPLGLCAVQGPHGVCSRC